MESANIQDIAKLTALSLQHATAGDFHHIWPLSSLYRFLLPAAATPLFNEMTLSGSKQAIPTALATFQVLQSFPKQHGR